ncbi:ricin-type beta-trefoil lectin domain protein [Streptomyces sp. INA 01156]
MAGLPTGPEQTLLRNAASGLCLDTRGEPRNGVGTRLAPCSSRWSQQWTYEDDGLLRSVADPGLCLDSHKDAGVVVLATCAEEHDGRATTCATTSPCRASCCPDGTNSWRSPGRPTRTPTSSSGCGTGPRTSAG